MKNDPANLLSDLLKRTKTRGADGADFLFLREESRQARLRLGAVDSIDASESAQLGLRYFLGKRQALVATTDLSSQACAELIDRAHAMAQLAPEDPYCGLATCEQTIGHAPNLDICDPDPISAEDLTAMARETEAAALAVPGVTKSDEAEASWGRMEIHIAQSNGFVGHYSRSHCGVSVAILAGEGTGMERDYDYSSAAYRADLRPNAEIGRSAGQRTVRRLGARKMPTGKFPVIFEPRVASSFVGHLASAINGASIARGTSFLQQDLGKKIFPAGFTIIDDPHRPRGLSSRPFDAEGIASMPRNLIENGVLTTWLLDLRSARQLGLQSTGHAVRSATNPPGSSPSNCHIGAGPNSPEDLIKDIKQGLYVTELIGSGVNGVTGDYSRGASGFWIENGCIAHPVNEMTIAGNLRAMFAAMTAANDLELRRSREAPTLRIEGMTVAGL